MAKRGWVGAQVADGRWMMLTVWDDGWVEVPGFGRTIAHTRQHVRSSLRMVAVVIGGLAAVFGMVWIVSRVPASLSWLTIVPLVGFVGFALYGSFRDLTLDRRRWLHIDADRGQRLADERAGTALKRRPGAPLFRRPRSAEQYADWVENETLVRAVDIASVAGSTDGADHLAAVTLRDGQVLTYRSPDAVLTRLLTPFDPATKRRQLHT